MRKKSWIILLLLFVCAFSFSACSMKPAYFTVTFEPNNGESAEILTMERNTQISLPTAPEKTDFIFLGWFDNSELSGTAVTFPFTLTENTILYAAWAESHCMLTYDFNNDSEVEQFTLDYGSEILEPTEPEKMDYIFLGWFDNSDLSGTAVTFPFTLIKNTTLYASWADSICTLTYYFNNDSETEQITLDYGSEILQPSQPERIGHTFIGWFDNIEHTGNAVTFPFTIKGDKWLYAAWQALPVNLYFQPNNGDDVLVITQDYGTIFHSLGLPAKEGHTFAGWFDNIELEGYSISFGFTVTENRNLYAKWNINRYAATFYLGDETFEQYTMDYGSEISKPDDEKEGYTFSGWFENPEFTGEPATFPFILTDYRIFYGEYTINQYTVTYVSYFGITVDPITDDYGTPFTSPELTYVNYVFKGWFLDSQRQIPNSYTTIPAQDITLYAFFDLLRYKITFESNGGSSVSSIDQMPNYSLKDLNKSLPNPFKNGYTFGGWYSNASLQTSFTSFTPMPTHDVTLYAKWEAISYSISYVLYDGFNAANPYNYYINSGTIVLKTPTKTGYTFLGWFTTSAFATQVTQIPAGSTGVKTFHVKWEIKSVTMTFETNGGNTIAPKTQNYNTAVTAPSNPTKQGYGFDGWFSNAALTTPFTFSTMPANSITLYAKWIHEYTVSVSNNQVTITGLTSYGRSFTTLTVPEQIEGLTVAAISANAFQNHTTLTTLTIPRSITAIGKNILKGCNNMRTLTAPFTAPYNDNTTSYLGYYFSGITYSTNDAVPSLLSTVNVYGTVIADNAFYKCVNVEVVNYLDEVTSIGSRAFMMCYGLKNFSLPNTLLSIGSNAFNYCTRLTTMTLPLSVQSVGEYAFSNCAAINTFAVLNANASIARGLLNNCNAVRTLTVPFKESGNNFIGYYFDFQSKLYNDEIPAETVYVTEGTTLIPAEAFQYATPLKNVFLPSSLQSIGGSAFRECTNLIKAGLKEGLTSVGNDAFFKCYSLTDVTLPSTLISIGSYAFAHCRMQTVLISASVLAVDSYAFYDCINLTIYCEASSKPAGWHTQWNYSGRTVVWGYTGE